MPYPRLLNLSDKVKDDLKIYLNDNIFNLQTERGRFLSLLKDYQKIYWAEPSETPVTFPFQGAANLIIPLSAISIETIHARNMSNLYGLPQIVTTKSEIPDFVGIENKFGDWYNKELLNHVGIKSYSKNADLERVKFGNCVGRASYVYEVKRAVKVVGDQESEFDVVTRNGAIMESVPVARFLMPFTNTDPQRSPIVGEELTGDEFDLRNREAAGEFFPGTVDKLKAYLDNANVSIGPTGQQFTAQQQELEKKTPSPQFKQLTYGHYWFAFNTDENKEGVLKEIVIDYHYESSTIMSVRYNWYEDLHRPYRIGQYFPIEHRWTGVGVCKQLIEFQKEITIQHRQRIDNATLANTRMLKINKLTGYGPGEPIFPGKMWFVDDKDHIDVIQMADVYNSAYNNEQSTLIYAQQRSGIDDLALGMQQAGTPGTATENINRVQENRGKHGYYLNNFKDHLNELHWDALCIIQQYGPRDVEILDRLPDGQIIKSILAIPHEQLKAFFNIKIISVNENKERDKQDWMQLSQMSQQYWQGMLGLGQMIGAPQLMGMIALQAIASGSESMRQIYEAFDAKNVNRLVLSQEVINGLNQLLIQGGGGRPSSPQQTQGNNSGGKTVPPNPQG